MLVAHLFGVFILDMQLEKYEDSNQRQQFGRRVSGNDITEI